LLFRFIDTAGLRQGEVKDEVEVKGIERTMLKVENADVLLAVAEATEGAADIAEFANSIADMTGRTGAKLILVINKSDLISQKLAGRLKKELSTLCSIPAVFVSAKNSSGLDELKELLTSSVETGSLRSPQYIVTNARHYEALKNVSSSLQRALDGFHDCIPTVLIATDVRQAIYYLGLITGRITPDDILGEIFSKFCIGK
jgi:tRNA modification GTPase